MKINATLISSAFCILLFCGFGFGYKPVKLYEGTIRADTETTALIHGFSTEYQGESWLAMLVGVDGKMCPVQAMTGDNGPTPKNLCGNISVVLPGEHVFIYALQTANQIGSGPNNSTTNSWKRLDYFISTKIVVEPGTIYAAKPAHDNDKWTVSLLTACKSKNFKHDAQWFISRRTCS